MLVAWVVMNVYKYQIITNGWYEETRPTKVELVAHASLLTDAACKGMKVIAASPFGEHPPNASMLYKSPYSWILA
jgi:hypothetical protein